MNYRKISESVADKLTLSEIYGFYVLSMKSDYKTNESHIKQSTFAELCNISERTAKRWIKKFRAVTLIETKTHFIDKVKKNTYKLYTENYRLINDGLLSLNCSNEIKGFLILIKCRCYNNTNLCSYTQTEIAETTKLDQTTISRYINKCIELGYINKTKEGYILTDNDIFIIDNESTLSFVKNNCPEYINEMGFIMPFYKQVDIKDTYNIICYD